MCPVIRISEETYARLETHAVGFDSPANVIDKILDQYENKKPSINSKSIEAQVRGGAPENKKRLYTNKEIQQKISAVAQCLSSEELENLCHKSESKRIFDINFPLFVKLPVTSNQTSKRAHVKTDDEVSRWTWKYEFEREGFIYAICTQWYAKSDALVKNWLAQQSA